MKRLVVLRICCMTFLGAMLAAGAAAERKDEPMEAKTRPCPDDKRPARAVAELVETKVLCKQPGRLPGRPDNSPDPAQTSTYGWHLKASEGPTRLGRPGRFR